MNTGLVSVSFRQLSPDAVIDLACRCGLQGIEWGGDVHVPPEDIEQARRIGEETRRQGLSVVCYGSYYRLTDAEEASAERVIAAAEALGAPLIRVWAGKTGSAEATAAQREEIIRNARRFVGKAKERGIGVAFEWHGGTLTDTLESALDLLENVPGAVTLWQPPVGMSAADCVRQILAAAERISNIHVFSWQGTDRLPLTQGAEKWRECLAQISRLPGEHWLMMEFVQNDDPRQLEADAETLRRWLKGAFGA